MNHIRIRDILTAGERVVLGGVLTCVLASCSSTKPESASESPSAAGSSVVEEQATKEVTVATSQLQAEPEKEMPPLEGAGWTSLFDGTSLDGWRVTEFAGRGEVGLEKSQMVLRMGAMLTGVNLVATNDLPTTNYELALDAKKAEGSDFFCALTFPVGESCCTFLLGGWGGGVVGISSIDGNDASLNETTKYMDFEKDRWYRVRVRVTPQKLEAWVGAKQMVDVPLEGKRMSVRPGEIELSQPWGIATWQTTGAIQNVQLRRL